MAVVSNLLAPRLLSITPAPLRHPVAGVRPMAGTFGNADPGPDFAIRWNEKIRAWSGAGLHQFDGLVALPRAIVHRIERQFFCGFHRIPFGFVRDMRLDP